MDSKIYSTPDADLELNVDNEKNKAGIFLKVSAVVFTFLTMLTGYMNDFIQTANSVSAAGGALSALILGVIILGLFQIGRGFRNQLSRYKIYLWSQIVFFVMQIFILVGKIAA